MVSHGPSQSACPLLGHKNLRQVLRGKWERVNIRPYNDDQGIFNFYGEKAREKSLRATIEKLLSPPMREDRGTA